jgi:hypothetical protein
VTNYISDKLTFINKLSFVSFCNFKYICITSEHVFPGVFEGNLFLSHVVTQTETGSHFLLMSGDIYYLLSVVWETRMQLDERTEILNLFHSARLSSKSFTFIHVQYTSPFIGLLIIISISSPIRGDSGHVKWQ